MKVLLHKLIEEAQRAELRCAAPRCLRTRGFLIKQRRAHRLPDQARQQMVPRHAELVVEDEAIPVKQAPGLMEPMSPLSAAALARVLANRRTPGSSRVRDKLFDEHYALGCVTSFTFCVTWSAGSSRDL